MRGPRTHAPVFAALGDPTRLALLGRLCSGESLSISQLSENSRLTRQAITKHLRVLEQASLVQGMRRGRERRFCFSPQPVSDAMDYLRQVSSQWDVALGRLKAFVEAPKVDGTAV